MARNQSHMTSAHLAASKAGVLLAGLPVDEETRDLARTVAAARGIGVQQLVTSLIKEAAAHSSREIEQQGAV
jgi:acyl-CoA synthetase (AMP-forming)/AMP-acid ligase II